MTKAELLNKLATIYLVVDNFTIVEAPADPVVGITKYTLDVIEVCENAIGIGVSKQRNILIHVQGDGTEKETAFCANSSPINTLVPMGMDETEQDYYTRITASNKAIGDKIKALSDKG